MPDSSPTASPATASTLTIQQIFAGPMGNCLYIVADEATSKAFIVDPAWDPIGLIDRVESEGMTVEGVLLTHTHPDHMGGDIFGQSIPGLKEMDQDPRGRELDIWVHSAEASRVTSVAGIPESRLRVLEDGHSVALGDQAIEVLHTPGHSPGCVCFLSGDQMIAGDTLFVQGCGRVDLPGSDIDAMYHSLQRLAQLPENVRFYPGHNYGPAPSSTIGEERETNMYLRVPSLENWRFLMNGM